MEIADVKKQFQQENLKVQKRIIELYQYLKLKCMARGITLSSEQEDRVVEIALHYSHITEPEAIVNMFINAARQKNPKKIDRAIRKEFILVKGGGDE